MSRKLSFIITFIVGLLFLISFVIFMINVLGGLSSNGEGFSKNFKNAETFSVSGFKKKFGLKTSLVALDFKLNKENTLTVKADELKVKQSIMNSSSREIDVINGEIKIYINQEEALMEAFLNALKSISGNDSESKINLENTSLSFLSTINKTSFVIENFNGVIESGKRNSIKGNFVVGAEIYEVSYFVEGKDFEMKLSSPNISFKADLKSGAGKAMFSINSVTKFLNAITPDTININLRELDGIKNTIYFESDLSYNEVKRNIDFVNSKIHLFGDKEESIKIEALNNDLYRITLALQDFTINPNKNFQNVKFNEGKVPALQFGEFFKGINFEIITSVKTFNIGTEKVGIVKNYKSNILIGKDDIKGNVEFDYKDKFNFSANGIIQNYESNFRKAVIYSTIKSENYENRNIIFDDFINIKNLEPANLNANINFILAGETAIIEMPLLEYGESKIENSKIEFDIYKPKASYVANINARNIDLEKVKLKLHPTLKSSNQDLFKIMFDYLKFKNFNYVDFNCSNCKAGEEILNIIYKQSTSSGKVELEKFTINSANIDAEINGNIDVRNPEKNILNLFVDVKKWNNITPSKPFLFSNIVEGFESFKLPSLELFSGTVLLQFGDISNGVSNISKGNMLFALNNGSLKSVNSLLVINNISNVNFINLSSNLTGNNPEFKGSLNVAGLIAEDLLSFALKEKDFDVVKGYVSIGAGFSSRGFLATDLLKNLNINIEAKSSSLDIKDYNIDSIAQILLSENLSFKKITNPNIWERRMGVSKQSLTSTMKFANNEITIEMMELKGKNSTNVFVGKLLMKDKPHLQMIGKTVTAGANLNNNLQGVMPVYLTSSITSKTEEEGYEVKIDFSQVNKYAEARRVLFK